MKIGILTSSRADYGIYLPLLNSLKDDPFFNLEIIAFGTHLSKSHGYTINDIEVDGYKIIHKISSLISNDDEQSISTTYALTCLKFCDFWNYNKYDIVLCLGDRFEMSAAVQAAIPYGVKFAHIHGGETTLGAIDNIYRHQISLASTIHFTATELFSSKVIELIGDNNNVYNVGALSLDGIKKFQPIDKTFFFNKYNIPQKNYALVTFHPETISGNLNESYANEMVLALGKLTKSLFLIITMPNADTMGSIFRNEIEKLKNNYPNAVLTIENFGKENYFTAMYYAKVLIGNTSSGILEAASFGKYVVNVGNRQKGRLQSKNVYNVTFQNESITDIVNHVLNLGEFKGENLYYQKDSALTIIEVLKKYYASI
ncbi:UDP-N-acetylglucosamine 2-epimerase [Sediminibacterium sp.]|uniref:UDP-N-acetylglucosamine 2-epimerase n=1 Tax=Sediminibacterium sp. TaxID=1917865 RepID=UPI00273213F5|nr:UDP-N-acetylglucosamine 2-epimerase [Sediminibacterium sp.]MDP2420230.1 UDP-N-acetylglucosamine 2-epimerase [Sediminibacterium sp.]